MTGGSTAAVSFSCMSLGGLAKGFFSSFSSFLEKWSCDDRGDRGDLVITKYTRQDHEMNYFRREKKVMIHGTLWREMQWPSLVISHHV